MAKKLLIESPPASSEEESSSSEEEASSDEECQLKKGKSESNSHTSTKAKEESGEETEDGDSEDEESDENNETEEPKPKSERQNSANKTHEEQDGSSDSVEEPDEESKEGSDAEGSSDSEEEESKEDIKVEVPKPSEDSKRVANDRGKKPNGLKSEVMPSPSASPLKVKTEDEDTKKDFFARLWSFEDEIILLNSILEFRLKEGKDVDSSSLESFCEFLKGKLSFTDKPEHRQVSGKIKTLKKKYTGAAVAHFTKEHDLKMKDIASQVWVSDVKSKPLKRKCSLLEEEVSRIFGSERKFDFVDVEEAEALEEELREQKRMKVELDLKRMDLITETFKLIMEGIQKSYGF